MSALKFDRFWQGGIMLEPLKAWEEDFLFKNFKTDQKNMILLVPCKNTVEASFVEVVAHIFLWIILILVAVWPAREGVDFQVTLRMKTNVDMSTLWWTKTRMLKVWRSTKACCPVNGGMRLSKSAIIIKGFQENIASSVIVGYTLDIKGRMRYYDYLFGKPYIAIEKAVNAVLWTPKKDEILNIFDLRIIEYSITYSIIETSWNCKQYKL